MKLSGLLSVALFRGLTALIAFALILLLMHYLDIAAFASFSFYYTCFTLCSVLPNIGVNNSVVLNNENNEFTTQAVNIRIYQILFSLLLAFIFFILDVVDSTLILACLAGILSSIFDLQLSFKQAAKNLKAFAYFMPIKTCLVFFIALITLFISDTFVNDIFINLSLVFFIIFIVWFFKNINNSIREVNKNIEIYKVGKNILLFEMLALLMARAEVFILTFYSSKEVVVKQDIANFWSSYNFILIISMLGTTLSSVMLPYMKESISDYRKINRIANLTFLLMVVLVVCVVISSYILGSYFLNQYKEIYKYIFFMGLGVCFSFISNVDRMKIVSGVGSNNRANMIIISQFIFSIILNIVLIYIWGIWGSIFTFVFIRAYAWFLMRYEVRNDSKYMG
ncbi:hypothetical protein V8P95_17565 [Acinetobacter baumannii]|nr:hypothetical protein [Acinetobacter baumannii]